MPKHSPRYYEEKIAEYNSVFLKYISELNSYRSDIVILKTEKERLLGIVVASKMIMSYSDCVKFAAQDVAALPNDYVPGFETLFNMENIMQYNDKYSTRADNYSSDISDVIKEIDSILDTYGEIVSSKRDSASEYRFYVNNTRAEYCNDYGMEYTPVYDDDFFNSCVKFTYNVRGD